MSIPPGFSLIEKGRLSILLKNEYRQHLLTQGIDDPEHLRAQIRRQGGKSLRFFEQSLLMIKTEQ